MNSTQLHINNRQGVQLSATIEFPTNQKPSHIAIFSHCFTCSSSLNAVRNINRALTQKGFAVVRFDFTGLGKSGGDFKNSHFEANVEDLLDVHAFISEKYFAPELIIGHSLGGSAAIVAASKIDAIKAVCTIGSPSDVEHTTKHFKDQVKELNETGQTKVSIGGRKFLVNQEFVDGFKRHNLPKIIQSLRKPILILHSPIDEIVSVKNAQEIYQNALHPKSYVSLDDADHLLTKKEDSIYAGNIIAAWVRKYLPKVELDLLHPNKHQLIAHLHAKEDKFTTSINSTNHSVLADEPQSFGGTDYGMSPYELVTSGLAACTAMTINLYAERKKWVLDDVNVFLSHTKEKNAEGKLIDVFKKEIEVIGDLTTEQKDRLVEIGAKCPVHKTLSGSSIIETLKK